MITSLRKDALGVLLANKVCRPHPSAIVACLGRYTVPNKSNHSSLASVRDSRNNQRRQTTGKLFAQRIMSGQAAFPHAETTQAVDAALTSSAVFLVLSMSNAPDAAKTIRSVLGGLVGILKTVSFRDSSARLSCVAAIGCEVWEQITNKPRPKELHRLPIIQGKTHSTVSTPGDLLFHIRAERRDLCFEFERQLLESLGEAVDVVDETVGFRYFDARDLLGFVDGTANPVGDDAAQSAFVANEDQLHEGGSYVVVQKYLHDLAAWNALSVAQQESVVGRSKLENIEQDDATSGQRSHKTLATIQGEDGIEYDILRDNMPFGSPASKQYGTYFIGYSRRLWVIEKMLERMYTGDPHGLHDRILDFSRPITGTTFFAPSLSTLTNLE